MSEDADIRLDQPQASTEGGVEVVGDDEYTKPEASVVTAIRKGIPTPESEPVARLTIMPGRIGREHDSHPGQPMAYFVRTEWKKC